MKKTIKTTVDSSLKWIIDGREAKFLPWNRMANVKYFTANVTNNSGVTEYTVCRCGKIMPHRPRSCPDCGANFRMKDGENARINGTRVMEDVAEITGTETCDAKQNIVHVKIEIRVSERVKNMYDIFADVVDTANKSNDPIWQRMCRIADMVGVRTIARGISIDRIMQAALMNCDISRAAHAAALAQITRGSEYDTHYWNTPPTKYLKADTELMSYERECAYAGLPRWLQDTILLMEPVDVYVSRWGYLLHGREDEFARLKRITEPCAQQAFKYMISHGMMTLTDLCELVEKDDFACSVINDPAFVQWIFSNYPRFREKSIEQFKLLRDEGSLRAHNVSTFIECHCSRSEKARNDRSNLETLSETDPIAFVKRVSEYAPKFSRE